MCLWRRGFRRDYPLRAIRRSVDEVPRARWPPSGMASAFPPVASIRTAQGWGLRYVSAAGAGSLHGKVKCNAAPLPSSDSTQMRPS